MRISDWSSDVCSSDLDIVATCRLKGRTGVEMEALTAASVAALTLYDMVKAVDRGMRITDIRLLHKSGGKRSEERRVGKECVSTCSSRWSPDPYKKKQQ